MKRVLTLAMALLCLMGLMACGEGESAARYENIPFEEGQLYAVACMGYQDMSDAAYYRETYLNGEEVPVHYVSDGEYYLIVPRYDGMTVELSLNNLLTGGGRLFYRETDCRPFIVQCNVSDIFPDVNVRVTYQSESVEFSPYISLKDGSVVVGERGLELTKEVTQ